MIKRIAACNNCQACQYIKMENKSQAITKYKYIKKLYQQINFNKVEDILIMEDSYNYRHKNQVAVSYNKKLIIGNYKPKSKKLVNIDNCLINHNLANDIFQSLLKLSVKYKLQAYDQQRKQGLLKHFFVRVGYQSNQVLVALVIAKDFFPKKKEFVRDLLTLHPEVTTINLNINTRNDSMVLSDQDKTIYGPGHIIDQMEEYKFIISTNSFYQVNPPQAIKLYNKAIELAQLTKDQRVLDAYCGIGTITSFISKHVSEVVGVEINPRAIKDAKEGLKLNKLDNISFHCIDALDFLKRDNKFDVVFVDPPRSGLEKKFVDILIKAKINKIVYIACDPDTQFRDIKQLINKGYKLETVVPVDLFPYTKHVETVALLSRIKEKK